MAENKEQQIQLKVDDETLKGRYANAMQVAHTKEEFILDFMNLVPPQGIITSRVITSPGHAKRVAEALRENIGKYEARYGKIEAAPAPPSIKMNAN